MGHRQAGREELWVPKPLIARERRAMASRNPASGEAEEAAIKAQAAAKAAKIDFLESIKASVSATLGAAAACVSSATANGALSVQSAASCVPAKRGKLTLYYWPVLGRGEFIRLALEEAGLDWEDGGGPEQVVPSLSGPPYASEARPLAPPYLRLDDGTTILSQTANIMMYIGERAGLVPTDPVGRARVNQVLLTVEDMVHEVNDTHHPLSVYQNYEEQKEAAIAKSRVFTAQRIPKFLGHLEETLRARGGVFICGSFSVADLALMHLMMGLNYAFPRAMRAVACPLLIALTQHVRARPRIKAYLASSRRGQFSLYDNFRAYPELDLQA